jgi:hypothetical protein
MFQQRYHYFIFFLMHVAIGSVIAFSSGFAFLWGLVPITFGLLDVIVNKNKGERAACWAAYATGMEVVIRMQEAYVTYESSKYYVIILLLAGLLIDRSFKKSSIVFLILLGLLLPSILLTDLKGEEFRKAILFNLSGPFTLIASGLYFFKRPINRIELNSIFVSFLMPIICTAIVLQFKTPDFSAIEFNAESNFETSGGFGPNQVSTIMGCAIFIILLSIILKLDITGVRTFDLMLLGVFTFRGIITFSRGGMISVVAAMACFIVFSFLLNHPVKNRFVRYLFIIVPAVIFIWSYSVGVTGGQIENRYLGKSARGKEGKDLTSGRFSIFNADYGIFLENPVLGAGVGMGKFIRERKFGYLAASHSEFSRLMAEHGSLGIAFLLLLLGIIVQKVLVLPPFGKIWIITFVVYSILTINHAAMRTALPGFIFGFAFIILIAHPVKKLA